jgi:hypothetical protein
VSQCASKVQGAGDQRQQAQVAAMGAQFVGFFEDVIPVDRNADFGRGPVALVMDDIGLRDGEALEIMEARIIAQIFPRRVFTVQRVEPKSKINHAPPHAILRSEVAGIPLDFSFSTVQAPLKVGRV